MKTDCYSQTVGDASSGIPTSKSINAKRAVGTVEGGDLRWRDDGVEPTTSVGHLQIPGGVITLEEDEVTYFRAIRTGTATTEIFWSIQYNE